MMGGGCEAARGRTASASRVAASHRTALSSRVAQFSGLMALLVPSTRPESSSALTAT
jgi:hypothetical protein